MRANLPNKNLFLRKRIPGRPEIEVVEFIASGNDGHVFRARNHEVQRDFACKIIPWANLEGIAEGKDTWRAEIERANAVGGSVVVRFNDKLEWVVDAEPGLKCVVLLSEFIRGLSLKDFIEKNRREITIPFVVQFLETMLDFLHELEKVGLPHGDLHAGNILVEDRSGSLRGPRYEFRVTDFGVAAVTSEATRFKDDYFQLADVLWKLLEQVDYQAAEPRDQFIFNALNNEFAKTLVERDKTLDPLARRPDRLFERLHHLDDDYEHFAVGEATRLVTPFDFLSCEQMPDDPGILKALYSNLFLGLDTIEDRNNVVVTGPRGCGKSTVFRNLSLRHRLRVDEALPDNTPYLGVYYFCNDLYFNFPRYRLPRRQEAWDIPVQFATATVLSELLEHVERWAERHYGDEFRRSEQRVSRKIWEALEIDPPREPGAESFKVLQTALQKQRRRAAFAQRNAHKADYEFSRFMGVNKLHEACGVLHGGFAFLRDRPIYFFIDDYSAPKVTKDLQANLNRVFMQRSSCCFFKLATESPVSFSARDIDGKEYVETREFNLLNLGQVYLRDESDRKLAFIEDVFRRRLSAADNFPVKDLETLVGTNPNLNANEEARQIRRVHHLKHWSKETLANLCSGDIHYLINLVRTMATTPDGVERVKKSSDIPRIPVDLQDKSIRDEAGKFLKNLRGSCDKGDKLVSIVTAFGKVANSYLKFRDSQNERGNPPYQATRVEPYEPLSLDLEAKTLYDELLRYSVFIEDYRGKSRRGDVVPRLFLRRFLVPHFNLTFSTRDSIQLEPADFQQMLLDPGRFEERFRIRLPEEVRGGELPLDWGKRGS